MEIPENSRSSHLFTEFSKEFASRYELTGRIAKSTWSTVYAARDLLLDREVAIKVLTRAGQSDEKISQRFQNEAKSVSLLNHPNIVRVFAYGWDELAGPYIAMEFLSGKTLAQVLKDEKLFNAKRFEEIFMPVLDALCFAHDNKIIHRDIKPENIIVSDDSSVKVLDFGISKPLVTTVAETVTNGLLGTPLYMSPEQCAGKNIGASTDIYSLACTMYECLSGRPPFFGESPAQTMYAHVHKTIPRLSDISSYRKLPVRLAEAVMQALSKNPSKRPASMDLFRKQIQTALASGTIMHRKSKAKFVLKLCLLLAVIILSCLTFFLLKQKDKYIAEQKKLIMKGGTNQFREEALSDGQKNARIENLTIQAMKLTRQNEVGNIAPLLEPYKDLVAKSNSPQKFLYYYHLASSLQSRGREDEAIEYYSEALRIYQNSKEKDQAQNKFFFLQGADRITDLLMMKGYYSRTLDICQLALNYPKAPLITHDFFLPVFMKKSEALFALKRETEGVAALRDTLSFCDTCQSKRTHPEAARAATQLFEYAAKHPKDATPQDSKQIDTVVKQLLSTQDLPADGPKSLEQMAQFYEERDPKLSSALYSKLLNVYGDQLLKSQTDYIKARLAKIKAQL